MKKLLLIILLISTGITCFAQTKPDTAKKEKTTPVVKEPEKPQYQADPNKRYHIVLDLTAKEILTIDGFVNGSLQNSETLSAKMVNNDLKDDAKFITKFMKVQADDQATIDFKKWQADTAKKAMVKSNKVKR